MSIPPNTHRRNAKCPQNNLRRGVIVPLFAVLMAVLIAAAAFTVDFAYMHLTLTELQTATDAAAKAGTYALGSNQNVDAARLAAESVAALNEVAGAPLELDQVDVVFGRSDGNANGSFTFVPGASPTSSVKVFGRRTIGSMSGPVSLFIGPIIGHPLFEPQSTTVATRLDRDICIVVDRSGSMAWDESGEDWQYPLEYQTDPVQVNYVRPPHATGSRWAGLVEAVHVFRRAVKKTPEIEKLALVSYSHEYEYNGVTSETVTINQPLTTRQRKIKLAINAIGEEPIIGGTNISAGITTGISVLNDPALARPHAFKMIILMTDGVWNKGNDPTVTALDAEAENIVIHTITFSNGANQPDMISIADSSGGKHYHAPTRVELKQAFEDIAYSLPVLMTE
jgi:Flp pilus assembly protein TadG